MKKIKVEDIILNIYRELYTNSEPKADFDKLVKEAEVNKLGEKEIPFMNYEISQSKYNEIIEKHIPKSWNRFKKQQLRATIALGCSPKFKENSVIEDLLD